MKDFGRKLMLLGIAGLIIGMWFQAAAKPIVITSIVFVFIGFFWPDGMVGKSSAEKKMDTFLRKKTIVDRKEKREDEARLEQLLERFAAEQRAAMEALLRRSEENHLRDNETENTQK